MGKDIWRFNRGEWTEAYVFLKLLSDGKIYGATEDLKKDLSKFIKIVSVTRPEKENFVLKYEPDFDSIPQKVSAMLNETEFAEFMSKFGGFSQQDTFKIIANFKKMLNNKLISKK